MSTAREAAEKAALVQFGQTLQSFRKEADLSQRELAKRTLISHQMIGAIERAERAPRKNFAERADKELSAHGALTRLWPGSHESVPYWFRQYTELEAEANAISDFQSDAIPGLFQTEEYARTVLEASWPPADPKTVSSLLSARMSRKKLLDRDPLPLLCVLMSEGVLRRLVGSTRIMIDQLAQLVELGSRSYIRLQVLPFASGAHAAMDGSFKVLDMSDGEKLAYAEIPGSGQVISDACQVEQCAQRFGALQALALSPNQSVDFISRYKEAHSRGIDPFSLAQVELQR
ncbi:helix-turn-helix transcriptional regulator [Nocardiopsis exhalans]|uniref:Helix-turn-helix transcriptional regulator n=1 Tax=Nocardiopsis exhalans TaxID=163604 RepID=A0ABY5DDY2_9ACTN|nr:helix-turn-helix transcriptional regulator [Nocardiopsis exhalans]USY21693.1 helix-turn-helix transcriptional regulator [Nocardiopsis exhalans]